MPEKRTLLITGAAGRIGTSYRKHAADKYSMRLLDVKPIPDPASHETVVADLSDPEAAHSACAGIDTVLHLAADPRTTAEFYHDLLDPNIKATYNIYRAAADQRCQRVIFASSVNAVNGYPDGRQVQTDDAPCPGNVYGATKAFGESLGAHFAARENLSVIAIRIGGVGHLDHIQSGPIKLIHSIFISYRDLNHLIDRCIETADIRFAIAHGLSNNRFNAMDISSTKALLGYDPQDDAFSRVTPSG